jgi:hypothetical protein
MFHYVNQTCRKLKLEMIKLMNILRNEKMRRMRRKIEVIEET